MSSSLFIAVGHDGLRMTSPDGRSWSEPQLGKEGETFRQVCVGPRRCVAAGGYGGKNIFSATSDGVQWEPSVSDAGYSRYVLGLVYGPAGFYGLSGDAGTVGNAKMEMLTSPDGVQWKKHPQDQARNVLRRAVIGHGLFVGIGDRGRRAWSTDGITWEDDKSSKPVDTLISLAFGAGRFVGVGLHGLRMSSADGKTWDDKQLGEEGEHLNSVLWTGEQFVAVGLGATYVSLDGQTWQRYANVDPPLSVAFGKLTTGERVFVGANWKGRLLRSGDGIAWEQTLRAPRHVEAVAFAAFADA